MKKPGQFGSSKAPAGDRAPGTVDCAPFEQWLAEFVEGSLPGPTMEQLRAHAVGCAGCEEKLAQARRGREWLLVLKQEALEPPAGMVAKILARTSHPGIADQKFPVVDAGRERTPFMLPAYDDEGAKAVSNIRAAEIVPPAQVVPATPAWQRNTVVVLRKTLIEPRLAMVAAMAFFSITLTLNLVGVRLTSLHAADLAPSNMRRAASRQYAEVNARMARYYENLRIVYEVEARVQQLRRAAETTPQQQQPRPRKRSSNAGENPASASHREGMVTKHSVPLPAVPDPDPVRTGPRIDAALRLPEEMRRSSVPSMTTASVQTARRFAPPSVTAVFLAACPLPRLEFSGRSISAPERGFA